MKQTAKINKNWFFEKINKINKPLARITKEKKRERTEISKIRNEKGEKTADNAEIQSTTSKYVTIDSLKETDKFPENTFQD